MVRADHAIQTDEEAEELQDAFANFEQGIEAIEAEDRVELIWSLGLAQIERCPWL